MFCSRLDVLDGILRLEEKGALPSDHWRMQGFVSFSSTETGLELKQRWDHSTCLVEQHIIFLDMIGNGWTVSDQGTRQFKQKCV